MGNRAVITTRKDLNGIGVYLHWNGGRDSVSAFLTYCKLKGFRPPERDNYGWAYLCTTIGNFFGGAEPSPLNRLRSAAAFPPCNPFSLLVLPFRSPLEFCLFRQA